jgi:hypothetical protein
VAVVAEAHVRATHSAAAGGERIIVTSGPFFYQDICKFYISFLFYIPGFDLTCKQVDEAADLGIPHVPRGEPGSTKDTPIILNFETTKAEKLLGLTQVTALKDLVRESVEDFRTRGYPGFST